MEEFVKYQVRRKLREIGAYQVVFEAWDPGLERAVELRVLRTAVDEASDAVEKFRGECRALAALDHPSFLKILDVGHTRDHVFYVTDPPTGTSLAEYSALGPVPPEAVIEIGDQLAQALEYLHGRGLLHRGLTLSGISYDLATGRAIISDYSVLKPMRGIAPTLQSMVGAEVLEAVPERVAGRPLDERSDLFLLGSLLYTLLSRVDLLAPQNLGRWPSYAFPPVTDFAPDCPRELGDFLVRTLARDPAERPASASAFGEELRAVRRKQLVRRVSQATSHVSVSGIRPAPALGSGTRKSAALVVAPVAAEPARESAAVPRPLLAGLLALPLAAALGWAAWVGLGAEEPSSPRADFAARTRPAGPESRQVAAAAPVQPAVAESSSGGSPGRDPADVVALAEEARARPTDRGTFLRRWDGVCAWADRAAGPTAAGPLPFPPRELTRLRMLSFRDMPEACRQLDKLLEPFAPTPQE